MTRSFLAQATVLIILGLATVTVTPAAASESTDPAEAAAESTSWLTRGYGAFLSWVTESVASVIPAKPSEPLPAITRKHGGSSHEVPTEVESTTCDLQNCTEAGADIDPNG